MKTKSVAETPMIVKYSPRIETSPVIVASLLFIGFLTVSIALRPVQLVPPKEAAIRVEDLKPGLYFIASNPHKYHCIPAIPVRENALAEIATLCDTMGQKLQAWKEIK